MKYHRLSQILFLAFVFTSFQQNYFNEKIDRLEKNISKKKIISIQIERLQTKTSSLGRVNLSGLLSSIKSLDNYSNQKEALGCALWQNRSEKC